MKNLRIKESQDEKIRQLAIGTNKKLVQLGRQPLRDSELVHILLNEALDRAIVDENGNVTIKNI
ncbi:hypothetical protein [Neisseria elongata]|jgi:hypothetical protein|uniref:Uncharacterized protein n=1 Tax=Neisseria elongata subsp. glycolytica ATCC 29315 TaxID=546263 RepID=D4DVP4_NEIEG|nr:hypothetical protein [Neisseria elongata]EFE48092.1 hypothetical protein NEIELOOT_03166 [Neisseria elongata subsp. glycolytica ATCC 29315]SQH49283.1 Uncharacterised protein [Neisseria elongata subsp. glycolytica]SQH49287.1 Uncharacterised protein [Neisseria elongata subsp. glycolytica]DAW75764.1 MAG TPA: hypothetical protein [Inoviridae sp.]